MGHRRRQLPLWASKLAQYQSHLIHLLEKLEHITNTTLSKKELSSLGIEVHELDLVTGATCRAAYPFFQPRADERCRVGNTQRNPDSPAEDTFTDYRRLRKQGIHVNMGLQPHLAIAFQDYAFDLVQLGQLRPEWRAIREGSLSGRRFHSSKRDRYSFHVNHGGQSIHAHQCHQQVWMESEDKLVGDGPLLAELIVLVSWILDAMRAQKRLMSRWDRRVLFPAHHTFPILLISFQPRARARVLSGYYDGTLKIQMSGHQEFDVPDYVDRMDGLLKWAWPHTNYMTTRIMPLPTIVEDDEQENEIEIRNVKFCGLSSRLAKWRGKKKWPSLRAIALKEKTGAVDIHKCVFET